MRLFAERLLVDRVEATVPAPDRYDDALGVSVTADGDPFVEAPPVASLVTMTEAEGEGDPPSSMVTRTLTEGEGVDEPEPRPVPLPPSSPRPGAASWAATITRADGEAPDASPLATKIRQGPGELLERGIGLWAITKTAAPGESPER